MTTLTLPPPDSRARLLRRDDFAARPPASEQRSLLLFSDDEKLWQNLLSAADEADQTLIRRRAVAGAPRGLGLLKLAAVFLDLDSPAQVAWDTADSLLQDANSPPLLLLTSAATRLNSRQPSRPVCSWINARVQPNCWK